MAYIHFNAGLSLFCTVKTLSICDIKIRLIICGVKISRFNENDKLTEINFGVHEYHGPRK